MPREVPLALIETIASRQLVTEACERAQSHGIRRGMTLAEARALCADVAHANADVVADRRGLEALGRWMIRFSPLVALEPPNAIFLDLTGCERLFGGIEPILARLSRSLSAMGVAHQIAIAPTPGAAYALAAAGDGEVLDDAEMITALASLPPAALRIEPAVAAALEHVGIVTIGQLMQIPRSVLPARFGHDLLLRLDQALGQAHEALVPLEHHRPIIAVREFDTAVDSLEAIWLILKQLIEQVIADLARRGCGARELKAAFKPMYGPAVGKCIHLSQPSRDPSNLFNLLRCALEMMHTDEGFVRFELAVPVFERISEEQISLTRQEREQQSAAAELGQLIERLCARLGREAVEQARAVESYIPEYAYACGAVATVVTRTTSPCSMGRSPMPLADTIRPLHLLRRPVEIAVMVSPSEDREGFPISFTHGNQVHPLRFAVGPERIACQWWDGHDKTRDYFDVENPAGRRFWIFRVLETWKWYLHGEFE